MDILSEAASLLTWDVVGYLLAGALLMQIVAMIPGLGGPFLVALILPFTYAIDNPMAGIALIIGAAATSNTGNSITAILFGIPGSAGGIATLFDGPAMARSGQASRAIGAAMTSSFVGAVVGAACLIALIPLVRPVIVRVGPAEFVVLVAFALIMLAFVEKRDTIRALISGTAGVAISFVGLEGSSGSLRYTFGSLYLWDGIQIVPLIIGLFAISEMMHLVGRGQVSMTNEPGLNDGYRGLWVGIVDAFRYWRVTLQSSFFGVLVGLVPGISGTATGLVAYSQGSRVARDKKLYGHGSVEGVIAADAANNAKEGSSLVPTLALGIPGGTENALVLVGLMTLGVQPGAGLVTDNVHIIWFLVALLILSNLFATLMTLAIGPMVARVTNVPLPYIAGAVTTLGLFGAFQATGSGNDVVLALIAGVLGYVMICNGYSRILFIVGLVLGPLLENNLLLSVQIYGWTGMLTRPVTLGMLGVGALLAAWSLIRKRRDRKKTRLDERADAEIDGIA